MGGGGKRGDHVFSVVLEASTLALRFFFTNRESATGGSGSGGGVSLFFLEGGGCVCVKEGTIFSPPIALIVNTPAFQRAQTNQPCQPHDVLRATDNAVFAHATMIPWTRAIRFYLAIPQNCFFTEKSNKETFAPRLITETTDCRKPNTKPKHVACVRVSRTRQAT